MSLRTPHLAMIPIEPAVLRPTPCAQPEAAQNKAGLHPCVRARHHFVPPASSRPSLLATNKLRSFIFQTRQPISLHRLRQRPLLAPLFSYSYELLFPQLPSFDNLTNCRGVYQPDAPKKLIFRRRNSIKLFFSVTCALLPRSFAYSKSSTH